MGRRLPPDPRLRELEGIYREHHRRVRWVLRARAVPDGELDDLVHEAFVAIYARLGDRDPALPMATWIAGVARNVAFSHRRSFARRRLAGSPPPPLPELDPDEQLARRRAWDRLEAFLHSLDPTQREVFVLADVMGMRVPEVATLVDAPLNTLYSRLRIARRHFSERFGEAAEDALREAAQADAPRKGELQRGWLVLAGQLVPTSAPALVGTFGLAKWILAGTVALGAATVIAIVPEPPSREPVAQPDAAVATPIAVELPAPTPAVAPTPIPEAAPPIAPVAPRPTSRPRASAPAPTDDLARTIDGLRDAQQRIAAGELAAALTILDALPASATTGPLAGELRELLRTAACGAGHPERSPSGCPAKNPPAP